MPVKINTVQKNLYIYLYSHFIKIFYEKYGCAVIINTSFNVRGEPIVQSPEDAYRRWQEKKGQEKSYKGRKTLLDIITELRTLHGAQDPDWKPRDNGDQRPPCGVADQLREVAVAQSEGAQRRILHRPV